MAKTSSNSSGLGLFGVLTVIFVVLKLVGVINWSWWWVLLPFYGPLVIWAIAILIVLVVYNANK